MKSGAVRSETDGKASVISSASIYHIVIKNAIGHLSIRTAYRLRKSILAEVVDDVLIDKDVPHGSLTMHLNPRSDIMNDVVMNIDAVVVTPVSHYVSLNIDSNGLIINGIIS